MARRVSDPLQPIDLRQCPDEFGKAAVAVGPGVHILPEEDDLASTSADQCVRLVDNVLPWPRNLRAPGIRHDAIGAEFVAALLDGEEGAGIGAAPRWHGVEL